MDRCQCRPELSERFGSHWPIWISRVGNLYELRELVSYILRDTPKPWQLKAPSPKPTIKVKEARTVNRSPRKGTNGHVRERTPPTVTGTEALLIVENAFSCICSPYGFHCQVSLRAPKKWPKYRTPARVRHHGDCWVWMGSQTEIQSDSCEQQATPAVFVHGLGADGAHAHSQWFGLQAHTNPEERQNWPSPNSKGFQKSMFGKMRGVPARGGVPGSWYSHLKKLLRLF